MKKIILLLLTSITLLNINAQNSSDYIEEVYSVFKIKSFNPKNDLKKCDVMIYVRVADKFKDAIYHVELLPNDLDNVIFRDLLDFKDLSKMVVAKSYRQKGDVYEISFGEFYLSEYAKMKLVIIYPDGSRTTLPMDMTNYKNPITIMN